jgi:hypothetical protein
MEMVYVDEKAEGAAQADRYKVVVINTAGLKSE